MINESEQNPRQETSEIVVPVIEEEIDAGTRAVRTGSVRVDKLVEKRIRRIRTPLIHEDVEIRRVPVNRVVGEMPRPRREGDTVIVPVVEEELVITKHLILREEIHLVKRRTRDMAVNDIELNRESAEIRRLDAEGRVMEPRARRPLGQRILARKQGG